MNKKYTPEKIYIVFDQDTKQDIAQFTSKEKAEEVCDTWNKECHEAGGSSTQYSVAPDKQ